MRLTEVVETNRKEITNSENVAMNLEFKRNFNVYFQKYEVVKNIHTG